MKSSILENKEPFSSFELCLKIESLGDAQKIYTIFNSTPIVSSLKIQKEAEAIRADIQGMCDHSHLGAWYSALNNTWK